MTTTAHALAPGLSVGPSPATEPNATLGARAARASLWIMASYPLNMMLQLGRNLVLTRLLFPEAFGLMSLVGVFLAGVQMCTDIGISESIVQHPKGDDENFLQTAWTMQLVRSTVLWLMACILAYPVALFYEQPMLLQLVPVAAFANVLLSLRSNSITLLRRHLRVGTLTIFEQSMAIVQTLLVIVLAWLTRSVWSLVIASLLGNLIQVVVSYVAFSGMQHRFRWDRASSQSLTRFGRWIFFSSMLTFLATQLDRLALGKLVDARILGVYTTAFVLAQLPREVVNRLSQSVLFPALSEQARTDPHLLDQKVRKARSLLLMASLLSLTGIALISPSFFYILYDARYSDAGWVAQCLVIPMWFGILQNSAGFVMLALGDAFGMAMMRAVTAAASAALAFWFNHIWGLPGFIVGVGAGTLLGQAIALLALARRGIHCTWQDTSYTALGAAIIPSIVFLTHLTHAHLSGWAVPASDAGAAILIFVPFMIYAYFRVLPQYPQLSRFLRIRWGTAHASSSRGVATAAPEDPRTVNS